ncbi:unnamed protein product, partial [Pylaiella littoralis]
KDARHLACSARKAVEVNLEEEREIALASSSPTAAAIENRAGSSPEPVTGGMGGNKAEDLAASADRADEDNPEKGREGRAVVDGNGDAGGCQRKGYSAPNNGGAVSADAFVPLHGLLFLLGELHMKTPEEILEKANSSDKGGGLGALTTLARAVEQEEFR